MENNLVDNQLIVFQLVNLQKQDKNLAYQVQSQPSSKLQLFSQANMKYQEFEAIIESRKCNFKLQTLSDAELEKYSEKYFKTKTFCIVHNLMNQRMELAKDLLKGKQLPGQEENFSGDLRFHIIYRSRVQEKIGQYLAKNIFPQTVDRILSRSFGAKSYQKIKGLLNQSRLK